MPKHAFEIHSHKDLEEKLEDITQSFLPPNPQDPYLLPSLGMVEIPKKILTSTETVNFKEPTTMTFLVKLSAVPSGIVTISATKDNSEFTIIPSSLTFTILNYSEYQHIQVESNRQSTIGNITGKIILSATGGDYSGETKDIEVTIIAADSLEEPEEENGEFIAATYEDFIFPNGTYSMNSNGLSINTINSGGYSQLSTQSEITGFSGNINMGEPHIILAKNDSSVVSVYFKGSERMIFKTTNGGTVGTGNNLTTLSSTVLNNGENLKIIRKGDNIIEIFINEISVGIVNLSDLKSASSINDLEFSFGILSSAIGVMFRNTKVIGRLGETAPEDPEAPPETPEGSEIPVADLIDVDLIESTKLLGNTLSYSTSNVDNSISFIGTTPDRATIFMKPLKYLKFNVMSPLGWLTVFSNEDCSKTLGYYSTNPSGFGFVQFNGFRNDGYIFEQNRPLGNPIVLGDTVEIYYPEDNICQIKVNGFLQTTLKLSDYSQTIGATPRIAFKTDASYTTNGERKIVKILEAQNFTKLWNYSRNENYGYGIIEKLKRAIEHIININEQIFNGNIGGGSSNNLSINIFKGKQATVIGDSITADGSYSSQLQSIMELSGIQNLAIGGVGYTGGNFYNQISNISANSQLIVMAGGINDFRLPNELGTLEDISNMNTMYGALYLTFKRIAELHSNKKVVVALFHNNSEHVHTVYPAYDKKNNKGYYAWDYIKAMKQRAAMFGFPVADVYGESGINGYDHCTTDGIHLNAEGGLRMAEVIKDKVQNTPYYYKF